jgi:single-strand DNA-binding protein
MGAVGNPPMDLIRRFNMRSHSFQLVAVGHVAKQPELKQKGEHAYLNLCLVGNDYGGPDKEEIVTSLFFTAFGKTASALAANVRKGDQLIINAHIRDNRFTDSESGEATYAVSYIVDGFIFGAPGAEKREEFARASQPTAETKRRRA